MARSDVGSIIGYGALAIGALLFLPRILSGIATPKTSSGSSQFAVLTQSFTSLLNSAGKATQEQIDAAKAAGYTAGVNAEADAPVPGDPNFVGPVQTDPEPDAGNS